MKRIYLKNLKEGVGEVFFDTYDSVLQKEKNSYALCCDNNEQLKSTYDFFRKILPEIYTIGLEVHIMKKYIRKVVHVSTGSLAQLV